MANKKQVDGVVRKIVQSVHTGLAPQIVVQRYSKVCGLLQDRARADQAFEEYGKGTTLRRAQRDCPSQA